jgi:hypothetical protein
VVRRYAERLPANATGWFAALNDPLVGRALQFVHADPIRHPQQRRQFRRDRGRVGCGSLPAFNRAFKRVTGMTPGQLREVSASAEQDQSAT